MAYQLWNPATLQASRTFEAVIAASPTQIAWAPPCAARCRVLVLNLATGRQVATDLPQGRSAATAAFSPDQVSWPSKCSSSSEANDGGQAVQLELESIASGHLTAVPGTWLSSDALAQFFLAGPPAPTAWWPS